MLPRQLSSAVFLKNKNVRQLEINVLQFTAFSGATDPTYALHGLPNAIVSIESML